MAYESVQSNREFIGFTMIVTFSLVQPFVATDNLSKATARRGMDTCVQLIVNAVNTGRTEYKGSFYISGTFLEYNVNAPLILLKRLRYITDK